MGCPPACFILIAIGFCWLRLGIRRAQSELLGLTSVQGLPCCGRADFPLWKPRARLVPLTRVRWSASWTVVPAVYSPRALPSWPLTLASGLVNSPFPGPFQATQHPPCPFCHQSLYHSCSHPDLLSCSVLLYYFFPSFSFPKLCIWVPLMQS